MQHTDMKTDCPLRFRVLLNHCFTDMPFAVTETGKHHLPSCSFQSILGDCIIESMDILREFKTCPIAAQVIVVAVADNHWNPLFLQPFHPLLKAGLCTEAAVFTVV